MSDSPSLNIVFAGTPEFAAVHLQALINSHHNLVAVYTQPDRPAGRGKKLTPSPVKKLALENNLPVLQPVSLKNEGAQEELKATNADVMVVVAYGLLLPQPVLDTPKLGCINVHGSLLPKWRGAAPIQRAVEYGDAKTGVTIMQMDIGLDTGDMLLKTDCEIYPTDTSHSLHDRLAEIGPPALLDSLNTMAEGNLTPEKQSSEFEGTAYQYAKKIEKAEAELDWSLPAKALDHKIRAFNPFPICYTTLGKDRLKIHSANVLEQGKGKPGTITVENGKITVACGEGALELTFLQLPGKKTMDTSQFLNGFSQLLTEHSSLGIKDYG